jgi:hypothetical protein
MCVGSVKGSKQHEHRNHSSQTCGASLGSGAKRRNSVGKKMQERYPKHQAADKADQQLRPKV